MNKAIATETNKNISVSKDQNRVRNNSHPAATLASNRTTERVSPEFFESRESLYQLVDLIDCLFDGIIS